MNSTIFQRSPLAKRSLLQRIFQQFPQENAVIELNNRLATKDIRQVQKSEVDEIEKKYKLSLIKEFQLNLEEFYAVYLNYCLKDKILSQEEVAILQHLKTILGLEQKVVEHLHTRVGELVYKKSFEEAIADGRLTEQEEQFLASLENELKLPKELVKKISEETRTNFIQNYVEKVIEDERLSPNEEKEMQAIAKSLNVTIELSEENKRKLAQLKLYWALENLELPTIEPGINLQKNEECYLSISNVKWHELRTVRHRTSYSGYSTSFRVVKGFYLRPGSYQPRTYSSEEMKLIDRGTLYLTNKRILFTGEKKNSVIRLDKVLSITPYTDGLEIDKETGKSPLLILPERADIFSIVLERLLRERSN